MRKSTRIVNPLFAITSYFAFLAGLAWFLLSQFPRLAPYMPLGAVDELLADPSDDIEVLSTLLNPPEMASGSAIQLALAIVGAVLVAAPVTWVYFITTRTKRIDRSFAQTIMVLPVVVAGIAMIVQNSLALAFSLAGIVAAVRFRFALREPAHALYIFVSIAIGLGAGIGALGVSFVVAAGFVYINMLLWKLDYGANLTSPFFSFMTGRGRDDNEL